MKSTEELRSEIDERIAFLSGFRSDVLAHFSGADDESVRSRINRGMSRARGLVSEAGVAKSVALSPPPVVGGLGVPRADPFDFILQHYYGKSLAPTVADMIEQAIGVFESPEYVHQLASKRRGEPRAAHQRPETGSPTPRKEPDLPERITISWLLEHVPVRFWLWLFGLLAAAFAAGVRWGPLITG